jgi:hypothetical protein
MGKVIDKHTGRVGDENADHILGIKIHCRSGTSPFGVKKNIMKCFINQLLYLFGGIDRDVAQKRSSN